MIQYLRCVESVFHKRLVGWGSNLVSLAIFVGPQDAPDISSWNVSTSEAIMLNPKKEHLTYEKKCWFLGSPLKMFGTWQQRRPQRMIPLRANCTASAPDNASTSRMTCPTNLQSVWIKTLPAIHQHQRSWCSGKIQYSSTNINIIYIYIASSKILTANIFDGFWTWPQAVDFISSRGPHGCLLAKRQAEPSGAMSNGGLVRSTVGEITNWKARSTGSSAVNISMKHETSWHQDVAVSFQPEAYLCTGLGPNLPMALWPQAIVFILFCYGFGAVGHCGAWHLKFSIDSPDLNASWVPGNNNRLHLPEIRVQALGPPSISIHGRKQRIPKRWSVPKFEVLALNEASKLPWKMHVSWKKLREESRHLYQGFAPVPASVSDLHFPEDRAEPAAILKIASGFFQGMKNGYITNRIMDTIPYSIPYCPDRSHSDSLGWGQGPKICCPEASAICGSFSCKVRKPCSTQRMADDLWYRIHKKKWTSWKGASPRVAAGNGATKLNSKVKKVWEPDYKSPPSDKSSRATCCSTATGS